MKVRNGKRSSGLLSIEFQASIIVLYCFIIYSINAVKGNGKTYLKNGLILTEKW